MLFSLIPGGFGNRERVIGWFSTRLSSVCEGGLVEAWRTVRSAVRGGALCGPWPEGVWAGPARPSPCVSLNAHATPLPPRWPGPGRTSAAPRTPRTPGAAGSPKRPFRVRPGPRLPTPGASHARALRWLCVSPGVRRWSRDNRTWRRRAWPPGGALRRAWVSARGDHVAVRSGVLGFT